MNYKVYYTVSQTKLHDLPSCTFSPGADRFPQILWKNGNKTVIQDVDTSLKN